MKCTTILFGLAATGCAQAESDDYLRLKPTGSEITITYGFETITIPIFNPSNAPKFGEPSDTSLAPPAKPTVSFSHISSPIPSCTSSLAPPANPTVSFSHITGPIPSYTPSLAPPANPTVSFSHISSSPIPSYTSSLAPPPSVSVSFSVITSSIPTFTGSSSTLASSTRASPSTTPAPSTSATPSPSPSSSSPPAPTNTNNAGRMMRSEMVGVVAGGLVAGFALV
ncbi:hypothetical protein P280DRAFT_502784 [Massarina eburnea CBS 473.64]|uniref:Uncharacterized protein n=1 Tax=Massarina eburnea CBS 473.64 TaxID=1395130 RepID=A0A6A6SE10_9PLEO|nr:hypothetical protein P280DRAFT_502784 [Massarina eburnea CBS 473.64]